MFTKIHKTNITIKNKQTNIKDSKRYNKIAILDKSWKEPKNAIIIKREKIVIIEFLT